MQFEDLLNTIKINNDTTCIAKIEKLKELDNSILNALKYNNNKEKENLLESLYDEKKSIAANCYLDVETKIKKLSELKDLLKKESFYLKMQKFNNKNALVLGNTCLDNLINKSKYK